MAGYNHKMNLLLGKIMEKIAQFEVKADRFSVIKVIDYFLRYHNLLSVLEKVKTINLACIVSHSFVFFSKIYEFSIYNNVRYPMG